MNNVAELIARAKASRGRGRKPHFTDAQCVDIAMEYVADDLPSMRALAAKHGCSCSVIARAIKRAATRNA